MWRMPSATEPVEGLCEAQRRLSPRASSSHGLDCIMPDPFKGVVNVDIRDSEPDWAPFQPPVAPPGSPNVVYIVLDDVGFGALGCYGGALKTPDIDPTPAQGGGYTPRHTTAPCSPPPAWLVAGRQP